MIKVLHLVNKFYPIRSGTSERLLFSQPRKGFIHYMIRPCYDDEKPHEYYYGDHFKIKAINLQTKAPFKLANYVLLPRLVKAAVELIKKENIDILYGHNPWLFAAAAINLKKKYPEIPLLYEAHSLLLTQYENSNNRYNFLGSKNILPYYNNYLIKTEKEVLSKADFLICQTKTLASTLSSIYGFPMKKCVIAYNGIPEIETEINDPCIYKKYNIPNQRYAFYGGHLSTENGVDIIIELIKERQDVFFVLAGDGIFAKKLKELESVQKNLRYLGVISKEEYLKVLYFSSVLLFLRPINMTNNAFLALKILDAIKLNIVVLSTKLKIMEELYKNYDNIIFTTQDRKDIQKSLLRAISLSKTNKKSINRESDNKYKWKHTNNTLSDIYQELVRKKVKQQ